MSADGVAQVGNEGWLFLVGGTNEILSQYRGEFVFEDDWADRWESALNLRRREADELGAQLVVLLVPDKLPVMAHQFPDGIDDGRASAAGRLTAMDPAVVFPLEALRRLPDGAFLRTDTHLSLEGNMELARAVGEALGMDLVGDFRPDGVSHLTAGDLGSKFDPQVVEQITIRGDWGDAEVIEDNSAAFRAAGTHVGIRLHLRNTTARDPRAVVLFGDSYGFSAPHYQGLAWFLGQVFAEVHFVWTPFGWDPDYVRKVGAEVVICQGAERFAARPPELRIDVDRISDQVGGTA